jgi:Asp-tRNA(Asn)/Glu-tRNA(Gln) amidotransferase A subunit family amidase
MKRREFLKVGGATAAAAALGPWSADPTRGAVTLAGAELAYLPAHRQLELFEARELSPVDVLEAQIARTAAAASSRLDEAIEAARESERRYRRGDARVLEGVTVGSHEPGRNDYVADKLRQAGAVLHLQTTSGSRGGSAASLAAGMCTVATASGRNGSPGIPAAINGIYAFRRAHRRVATVDRLLSAASAPMARTLADTILLEAVIVGSRSIGLPIEPDIDDVRIAYCDPGGPGEVDAETRRNTARAVRMMSKLGAAVDEIELPRAASCLEEANAHLQEQVFRAGYDLLVMPVVATPFDRLTWYPVLTAPAGLSSRNVPTGLQMVGPSHDARMTIRVAARHAGAAPALFTDGTFPDFRHEA